MQKQCVCYIGVMRSPRARNMFIQRHINAEGKQFHLYNSTISSEGCKPCEIPFGASFRQFTLFNYKYRRIMQITAITGHGINHYDITDVNGAEMETLCQLKERVGIICESMKDNKKKTEYLTKGEYNMLRAVLSVLTRGCQVKRYNEFLEFLKNEKKEEQQEEE